MVDENNLFIEHPIPAPLNVHLVEDEQDDEEIDNYGMEEEEDLDDEDLEDEEMDDMPSDEDDIGLPMIHGLGEHNRGRLGRGPR